MLKIERTGLFDRTLDELAMRYEGIDVFVEQRIVFLAKIRMTADWIITLCVKAWKEDGRFR